MGVARTATGRRRAVQPTTFNPTTSLARHTGFFAERQEHLDAQKKDDSASRLRTLQSFLQTPIQRPRQQPFAIPKYDYSNTRWPCERPLDQEIIRIEGEVENSVISPQSHLASAIFILPFSIRYRWRKLPGKLASKPGQDIFDIGIALQEC